MAKHGIKKENKGKALVVGIAAVVGIGGYGAYTTVVNEATAEAVVVETVTTKYGNFNPSARIEPGRVTRNNNTFDCAEGHSKTEYLYIEKFTNDQVKDIQSGDFREICLDYDHIQYLEENNKVLVTGNVSGSSRHYLDANYVTNVRVAK